MHRHGPKCLEGPVSLDRLRWLALTAGDLAQGPGASASPAPSREDRPMRLDLIERVRREIAEGVYETAEKWEKALDRLLEELDRD